MNSCRCFRHGDGGGFLVNLNMRSKTCPMFLVKSAMYCVERAVVDGEEPDLVVFKRHELREMRRADGVQVLRVSRATARAEAICISMKARRDLVGRMTRNGRCSLPPVTSAAAASALISLARHIRIGRVDIQRMRRDARPSIRRKPPRYPRPAVGGGSIDMLENRVEHRSRKLGEFDHQRGEFAVEITEEQQRPFAQHRETRVVDRADPVLPP